MECLPDRTFQGQIIQPQTSMWCKVIYSNCILLFPSYKTVVNKYFNSHDVLKRQKHFFCRSNKQNDKCLKFF